jgi:hypothetical protein
MKREFSAGAIAVRRNGAAASPRSSGRARASGRCRRGIRPAARAPPRRPPASCARRRASRASSSRSSATCAYWYSRDGERVLKLVSFYLFRYRSGSVRDHDDEVEAAAWVPLEQAVEQLSSRGEREMAELALTRLDPGR